MHLGESREDCTEHKDATNSGRDVSEVKPQNLDQSNNNPENDSSS
jgi:hypothetical protein